MQFYHITYFCSENYQISHIIYALFIDFTYVHPQFSLTPCDPMDCSLSGSSVPGISQARILEYVVISSSRGSSRPRDRIHFSCTSCFGRWILQHSAIVLLERDLSMVIEYKINIINPNNTKLKILLNKQKVAGGEKEEKKARIGNSLIIQWVVKKHCLHLFIQNIKKLKLQLSKMGAIFLILIKKICGKATANRNHDSLLVRMQNAL